MEIKKIALWIAGSILLVAVWLYWWCQPERQVRRAQGRLISAFENRDFDALAHLLSDDYSDRWHHDKAFVSGECREVRRHFLTLAIERADRGLEMKGDGWLLQEKLTVKGLGGSIAAVVRDEVNSLSEPFQMTWHRRSWKPWDWELLSVEQPVLEFPR